MRARRKRRLKQRMAYGCLTVLAVTLVVAFILQSLTEARLDAVRANFGEPEALLRYEAHMKELRTSREESTPAGIGVVADPTDAQAAYNALFHAWDEVFEGLPESGKRLRSTLSTGFQPRFAERDWEAPEQLLREHPELLTMIREIAALGDPPAIEISSPGLTGIGKPGRILDIAAFAGLLMADATLLAKTGDASGAIDDILFALKLAELLGAIPESYAYTRRKSIIYATNRMLQQNIEVGRASDSQMRELFDSLANAHHRQHWSDSIETQVHGSVQFLDDLLGMENTSFQQQHAQLDRGGLGTGIALGIARSPFVSPIIYSNEAELIEAWESLNECARLPYYEMQDDLEEILRESREATVLHDFSSHMIEGFSIQLQDQCRQEVIVDVTRIGIAVELYHAEHGTYPESLDTLQGVFGGAVPRDQLTGESFVYTPGQDGFTLRGSLDLWRGGRRDAN